jgi:hypothetical protein
MFNDTAQHWLPNVRQHEHGKPVAMTIQVFSLSLVFFLLYVPASFPARQEYGESKNNRKRKF